MSQPSKIGGAGFRNHPLYLNIQIDRWFLLLHDHPIQ